MKMDRSRLLRTAAAIFATATVLPIAAATASASTLPTTKATAAAEAEFIECSHGNVTVKVNPTTKAVTGSGTVTDCVAQVNPVYTSATVTITGTATQITSLIVSTTTTETITWNTGATTVVAVKRSYIGASNTSAVGTGNTTGGLFHPAGEFDSGDGARTTSGGQIVLTDDPELIVSTS
jgi:hypothetical protein